MMDRQSLLALLAHSNTAGPMKYRREIINEQRVLPSVGGLARIIRSLLP